MYIYILHLQGRLDNVLEACCTSGVQYVHGRIHEIRVNTQSVYVCDHLHGYM